MLTARLPVCVFFAGPKGKPPLAAGVRVGRPRTRSMDKAEHEAAKKQKRDSNECPKAFGRVELVNGRMVLLS